MITFDVCYFQLSRRVPCYSGLVIVEALTVSHKKCWNRQSPKSQRFAFLVVGSRLTLRNWGNTKPVK